MLKKSLFASAVAFALAFPAYSQDNAGDIKPQAGDITAELLLNLGNSSQSTLYIDQLRGRYFLKPNMALRAGIYANTNSITYNNDDYSNYSFSIAPGIEKHFIGTERLSPYIATELHFGLSKDHHFSQQGTSYRVNSVKYGLNFLAGTDYYVAKRLFLGAEFGLGFSYTDNDQNYVQNPNDFAVNWVTPNEFNISTLARGGIRVGFVF